GGFSGDGSGRGQSSPIALPSSGTYFIGVTYNFSYEGEYRFRATLAAPGTQMETENNDSTGNANVPSLTLQGTAPVHQVATVAGYVGLPDGGDFYKLGNISAGTTITIGQTKPTNSGLSGGLAILNSSGRAVATSAAGASSLSFTVPSGGDGTYYARLTAATGTSGLFSQYLLSIDIVDTVPPTITGDTVLPAEGSTGAGVL